MSDFLIGYVTIFQEHMAQQRSRNMTQGEGKATDQVLKVNFRGPRYPVQVSMVGVIMWFADKMVLLLGIRKERKGRKALGRLV